MATAYVSKSGDDGAAVLDNPALPWRNADLAEAALSDGDTISFGPGAWTGSEIELSGGAGYFFSSKAISITASDPANTTFSSDTTTACFRLQGALNDAAISISGIVGVIAGDVVPNAFFYIHNSGGSVATVTIEDCQTDKAQLGSVYVPTASNDLNLTIDDHNYTCDQSDQGGFTSSDRGCFLYYPSVKAGSTVAVKDPVLAITNRQNSSPVINIVGSAAGASASILGASGSVGFISTFPTQECPIQEIMNIDDAVIDGLGKTISITTEAASNGTAAGAVIDCDSASLTAHRGIIRNMIINHASNGGFGARLGHDGSNDGDNRCNNGNIFNVKLVGSDKFRLGTGHGLFIGWCQDSNSSHCYVEQSALSLLCKEATGGGHFGHICKTFGRSDTGAGSAIQAKGCDNTARGAGTETKFFGNTIYLDDDCYGAAFVGIVDDTPDPDVNNTGVVVESNVFKATAATPANTSIMSFAASQGVTFGKNSYINSDIITKSDPMNDQGTTRTVAAWVSNVEDSANVDDNDVELYTASGSGGTGSKAIISNNIIS